MWPCQKIWLSSFLRRSGGPLPVSYWNGSCIDHENCWLRAFSTWHNSRICSQYCEWGTKQLRWRSWIRMTANFITATCRWADKAASNPYPLVWLYEGAILFYAVIGCLHVMCLSDAQYHSYYLHAIRNPYRRLWVGRNGKLVTWGLGSDRATITWPWGN